MKKTYRMLGIAAKFLVICTLLMTPFAALVAGEKVARAEAPVDLGTAGNFVILTKTGITNVPTSDITGNIGTSLDQANTNIAFAGITCGEVDGQIYSFNSVGPLPCVLADSEEGTTIVSDAVSDMEDAYTDAATRTPAAGPPYLNLGSGTLDGQNLAPGLYTWDAPGDVTITGDITLTGTAADIWILQITGTLDISSDTKVILDGAQAANIFWAVAGAVTLGTTSEFNGNILAMTNIAMLNGATLNGRALAQTAVTLDANIITLSPTVSTTVEVGSTTVVVGASSTVDVWVRDYPLVPEVYGFGLGNYDITVAFDPAELTIDSVGNGDAPFTSPTVNLTVPGSVQIAAFPGTGAPDGDIKICTLNFTCVAESVSTLALTVNGLADTDGTEMPNTAVDGTITQLGISITADPTSGPRGKLVSVTGMGFGANEENIVVTWDGTTVVSAFTAEEDGTWVKTFNVPTTATLGNHIIDAGGDDTLAANVPDVTFTVSTPAITINPATGPPGTTVTVNGTNFAVSEANVIVKWDTITVVSAFTAGADGSWSKTFDVPASGVTFGNHTIDASGSVTVAGDVADKTFAVTTLVKVGDATVAVDSTGSVDVWVRSYPLVPEDYAFGLGNYDITIAFDPAELTIDSVGDGDAPFTAPTVNLTVPGSVQIAAFPGTGAPDGDIKICTLNFTCVAESVSTLALTVNGLADTDGAEMANTAADGTITQLGISITADPTSGPRGKLVSVTGMGFGANEENIVVTWDGTTVVSAFTAEEDGTWVKTFNVPTTATLGNHIIDAGGDDTLAANVPDVTFTVSTPAITIATPISSSGPRGTTVTVTGANFAVSETLVTVKWDATTVVAAFTAGTDGGFSKTFTVPTTAALGDHSIDASGAVSTAAEVVNKTFNVSTPAIGIAPTSGPRGTTVTVTGTNFAVSETLVTVKWDTTTVVAAFTAGTDGGFSKTFTVPTTGAPAALGDHSIDASGAVSTALEVVNKTFTVFTPAITIAPTSGPEVTTTVTVNGTNFAVNEANVIVTWKEGTTVTTVVAAFTAGADGGFSKTFTVPAGATAGNHIIDASGAVSTALEVVDKTFNVLVYVAQNVNTAEFYFTVQDAIDDATAGNTIRILPGTHTLSVPITVNKLLTIKSDAAAAAILDASGLTADAVTITANGATFGWYESGLVKGITIKNATAYYGINLAASNCTVVGNILTANKRGIHVTATAASNTIMYNDIMANTEYGVFVESTGAVNATYNWWGNISGPAGIGAGSGNAINTGVTYIPWLTRVSSTVLADEIEYIGWEQTLALGWNIYSTPIALDGGGNEWGEIKALGNGLSVSTTTPAYYFDPSYYESGVWMPWRVVTATTTLSPLNAIYVKMTAADRTHILVCPDPSVTSKTMYAGWNLVGLANLEDMPVDEALSTIYSVTGGWDGYHYVVSPAINQTGWLYYADDIVIPDMVVSKGYWVFMMNPGILGGFTFTPLMDLPDPLD